MIRTMQVEDAEAVVRLDALAFSKYWQETGRGASLPARTHQNILACLDINPQGCLVAAEKEPVGYLFSRVWGEVGWIGTFGVHPTWQGRGIGKALLLAGVGRLKTAGCRVIGLETMPDSPYNIGFYARLGFTPAQPTLSLDKVTGLHAPSPLYELCSPPNETSKLATVTRISRAAWPVLDLAIEAQNAATFGWGETLLIGWPDVWAVAVVRTTPKRVGEEPYCEIRAMAVVPDHKKDTGQALLAVEAFAASRDLAEVYLHINAYHTQALQDALKAGFKVSHAMLRMLLTSDVPGPGGVELCRWAM